MKALFENSWRLCFLLFFIIQLNIGYKPKVFKSIELRRYLLNNGNLLGMLKTFWNSQLRKVQVFKDIQFATNEQVLRFRTREMFPTMSLSQLNIFSYNNSYGVCPQRDMNEKEMKEMFPLLYIEQMERKSRFLINQYEECFLINLFVPVLGKCIFYL